MTDDLEGLRIVGRELGRGVRPVGFDTLLATSVRRRRRWICRSSAKVRQVPMTLQ